MNPIINNTVANASPRVFLRFSFFFLVVIKLSGSRFASIGFCFSSRRASQREVAINAVEKFLVTVGLIVAGDCSSET